MKRYLTVKSRTRAESSNGKRVRKLPPAKRMAPRIAALRSSPLALISRSVVPDAGNAAAGTRANGVPMFLIEDNRPLHGGLTAMLGAQGLKVIATARSGGEAVRQVARLKPQLVLLSSALGKRDSLRLVQRVKRVSPDIKLIVMHLLPTSEDVVAYVGAGVSGFIMKDASVAEFAATIRSVADGGCVLPPVMTVTLFSHVAVQALSRGKRAMKAAMRMTAHGNGGRPTVMAARASLVAL